MEREKYSEILSLVSISFVFYSELLTTIYTEQAPVHHVEYRQVTIFDMLYTRA